ncbi:MAG: ATP synthase subunit I [Dethiobacteria bacterium]
MENDRRFTALNWFYLLPSMLVGCLVGFFFFGGLWWTVQKITSSRRPYLISVISFIVRTSVALTCFYLLLQTGWQNLLAAMVGFIAIRFVLAYKLEPERRPPINDHQSG